MDKYKTTITPLFLDKSADGVDAYIIAHGAYIIAMAGRSSGNIQHFRDRFFSKGSLNLIVKRWDVGMSMGSKFPIVFLAVE